MCPGGLGSAPVRTWCGVGAAAWIMATFVGPDTQGSHNPWAQEICCFWGFFSRLWQLCSSEDQAWRWHSYLDYGKPVGTRRRRQWHLTPVFLPGKSHGWGSLVGCSPWNRSGSDMIERLHFHFSLFTFVHWRRKWQPTPVFLPGESQGRGSLVGCHFWGRTESDTTEAT